MTGKCRKKVEGKEKRVFRVAADLLQSGSEGTSSEVVLIQLTHCVSLACLFGMMVAGALDCPWAAALAYSPGTQTLVLF